MRGVLWKIHDFSHAEARKLLHNKFVVVMGDSIYRSIYKDLVSILQTDELLTLDVLQEKGEETFANDKLLEWSGAHSRNNYREVREFCTDHHLVRGYFIPRVYSDYMERVLEDLQAEPQPDVVIVNSCLWDLNRYHNECPVDPPLPEAIRQYKQNLEKFFDRLDCILPQTCLAIWNTALPIRENPTARGLNRKEKPNANPRDVIEANFYGASVAVQHGFDVLDLHFYFRFQERYRVEDGVHWNRIAHRLITKHLLSYMADAWGVQVETRPLTGIERNSTAAHQPASPQPPPLPQVHCDFFANDVPIRQLPLDREAHGSYGTPYGNRPVSGFVYCPQDPSPQHGWLLPAPPPFGHHSDPYREGPGGRLDYPNQDPPHGNEWYNPDPQFHDHHNSSYGSSPMGGSWNEMQPLRPFSPEINPNSPPFPSRVRRSRRAQRRPRRELVMHRPHRQWEHAYPYTRSQWDYGRNARHFF